MKTGFDTNAACEKKLMLKTGREFKRSAVLYMKPLNR
jgi:hypothetical protein